MDKRSVVINSPWTMLGMATARVRRTNLHMVLTRAECEDLVRAAAIYRVTGVQVKCSHGCSASYTIIIRLFVATVSSLKLLS